MGSKTYDYSELKRMDKISGKPESPKSTVRFPKREAAVPAPAEDMEELRELLKDAEESEAKFNFVDNSDQAKAILITGMMTSDLDKLKHLSELDNKMINSLIVLGTVDKFLKKRKVMSPVRSFIYSEILTLMISHKRKGRQEFIDLGKADDGRGSMMRRLKEKFGSYVG